MLESLTERSCLRDVSRSNTSIVDRFHARLVSCIRKLDRLVSDYWINE